MNKQTAFKPYRPRKVYLIVRGETTIAKVHGRAEAAVMSNAEALLDSLVDLLECMTQQTPKHGYALQKRTAADLIQKINKEMNEADDL